MLTAEEDTETGRGLQHRRRQQPNNPLLLEEIASRILDYLDSYTDLEACYDVCTLWRQLARPRIGHTRPPVLIEGAITNEEGRQYIQRITEDPDPALLSTRFIFKDADLASAPVIHLLELHGPYIKQLELRYAEEEWKRENEREAGRAPAQPPPPRPSRNRRVKKLTKPQLHDLLLRKTPNLEFLILSSLPVHFYRTRMENLYNDAQSESESEMGALRSLEININYVGYSTACLICTSSPKLEELTVLGMALNASTGDMYGETLLWALQGLDTLKAIRFEFIDDEITMLLGGALEVGQLHTFKIESTDEVTRRELQDIFVGQASTLKFIEYSSDWTNGTGALDLPPMPNLEHLSVTAMSYMEGHDPDPAQFPPPEPLDYAAKFPRLRVLELGSILAYYAVAEIFPEPDPLERRQPAISVEVLQHLPRGVDRNLMRRIGGLFPNLRVIRTAIPIEHETLLIGVWESCPNLEELFIVLDEDGGIGGGMAMSNANRISLDSIFSGIPDEECKQLRLSAAAASASEDAAMAQLETSLAKLNLDGRPSNPSIRDLTRLRKLCIEGPGKWQPQSCPNRGPTLGFLAAPAPVPRADKLSNIFGYAALAKLSSSITFLQLDPGLAHTSKSCVQHICERVGLERARPPRPPTPAAAAGAVEEPPPPPLRLIRPGLGYHVLPYPLPWEWYGHKKPQRTSVLANPFIA